MTDTAATTRLVGRVKWFNNQSGYGFITYTSSMGSEEDVFVHHSALVTSGDQFRYLVQGEYVEFETTEVENKGASAPRTVAKEVRGMNGGMLMCETRHERRQSQQNQRPDTGDSDTDKKGYNEQSRARPRFRGGGPRVGDRLKVGGAEWKLVRGSNNSNRKGRPNKRSRTDTGDNQ